MAVSQRRYRTMKRMIGIRHTIPTGFTREHAVGLTAFCRKYGIQGQNGEPNGVEAVRFLVVLGLTPGAEARTRAAVAAHVNLKMMVGSVGNRASRLIAGSGQFAGEPEMFVKSRLFVRVDSWMAEQLMFHAGQYRDGQGGVLDNKMIYEFTLRGMADPDLDAAARTYYRLIQPMRQRMLQLEQAIRESMALVRNEWMKSMGTVEMPAALEED